MTTPPFDDPAVQTVFEAFPPDVADGLNALRTLIFEVAAETDGVGPLTETLKWGQPAYLTETTKAGSTLRLGLPKAGGYALYAHCQTTIISGFRAAFPEEFAYDGNRAVLFDAGETPKAQPMAMLIRSALTYHLSRKHKRRQ